MQNINFNTVWLVLTYNCNNKCKWCYANSNNLTERQTFPGGRENETVDLLHSLGIKKIILIGGEPTIYPNLFRIINKISKSGISLGLISNGRKFEDYNFVKNLKKEGLGGVSISLGSYCSEIQDEMSGVGGGFNQTMAGLENLLSLGLRVSSNTVINKENLGDLEKIVDLIGKKVTTMTWNFCGVCLSEESNNQDVLHPRETAKAIERIYDYSNKKGVKMRVVTPMPFCVFDQRYIEKFKEERIISGGPCQLSHGKNFVIEHNGNILPCTHFTGLPMMNIFKEERIISKEDFIQEYLNPEGIPFKFRRLVSKFPSNKCDDKKCKEPCTGGCPLIYKLFRFNEVIKQYGE